MERRLRITGTFDVTIEPADEVSEVSAVGDSDEAEPIGLQARRAAAPSSAIVSFGDPALAAPFPTDAGNEEPLGMVPQRVYISREGTVTFDIAPYHQVAIYRPGINLRDIDLAPERLEDVSFGPFTITDFRINDPRGRVQLSPPQSQSAQTWTTPAGTFERPGPHLVICTSTPHFVFAHTHGWIVVD